MRLPLSLPSRRALERKQTVKIGELEIPCPPVVCEFMSRIPLPAPPQTSQDTDSTRSAISATTKTKTAAIPASPTSHPPARTNAGPGSITSTFRLYSTTTVSSGPLSSVGHSREVDSADSVHYTAQEATETRVALPEVTLGKKNGISTGLLAAVLTIVLLGFAVIAICLTWCFRRRVLRRSRNFTQLRSGSKDVGSSALEKKMPGPDYDYGSSRPAGLRLVIGRPSTSDSMPIFHSSPIMPSFQYHSPTRDHPVSPRRTSLSDSMSSHPYSFLSRNNSMSNSTIGIAAAPFITTSSASPLRASPTLMSSPNRPAFATRLLPGPPPDVPLPMPPSPRISTSSGRSVSLSRYTPSFRSNMDDRRDTFGFDSAMPPLPPIPPEAAFGGPSRTSSKSSSTHTVRRNFSLTRKTSRAGGTKRAGSGKLVVQKSRERLSADPSSLGHSMVTAESLFVGNRSQNGLSVPSAESMILTSELGHGGQSVRASYATFGGP